MRRFIIILTIIILCVVTGVGLRHLMDNYSINYLYNKIIKREFAVNPKVEINPDRNYKITIWYYPFYRTITDIEEQEKKFFEETMTELSQQYPNIELVISKLNFNSGKNILSQVLKKGEPPDIYFNFSNDSLIDRRWQIPIEGFLSAEEKEVFSSMTGEMIQIDNHIWSWPFLAQRQKWLTGKEVDFDNRKEIYNKKDFIKQINNMDKNTLLFNYQDPVLLRQLLSLYGLKTIKIKEIVNDKIYLDEKTSKVFKDVFAWLHQLRVNQKFAIPTLNMDDNFLKTFLNNKSVVLGPVNPWLEKLLSDRRNNNFSYLYLDNLNLIYTLSIFRQKSYKGHDHTKAVMEVARIIAKKQSQSLADKLGISGVYLKQEQAKNNINAEKILEITPEAREYWEEKIIPVWLAFWKQGLTPAEVMQELNIVISK